MLHNWEDTECGIILRNLAEPMKPGYSRLPLSGMLVSEVDAGRLTVELDVQMWLLRHSRQRTKREIEDRGVYGRGWAGDCEDLGG